MAETTTRTREQPVEFREFFESESDRLVRAMYLQTGDLALAEDLCQEALVRAYERWDRIRTMASPTGYVFRIAFRLDRRRRRRSTAGAHLAAAAAPMEPPDPAARAVSRGDVARALRRLPAGQRAVVVLVEWLDLSSAEAAVVLGIQPSSVRARLHRARTAIRELLGDDYA